MNPQTIHEISGKLIQATSDVSKWTEIVARLKTSNPLGIRGRLNLEFPERKRLDMTLYLMPEELIPIAESRLDFFIKQRLGWEEEFKKLTTNDNSGQTKEGA